MNKQDKKRLKKIERAMALTALAIQEHEDYSLMPFFELFEKEKEKLLSRPDRLQAAIDQLNIKNP